jgi:hypothetical protein
MSFEEPTETKNATFLVKVFYRQNTTWQGEVSWLEGQGTRHFRSLLELLLFMDAAIECSAIKGSGCLAPDEPI